MRRKVILAIEEANRKEKKSRQSVARVVRRIVDQL
jgi:hypothetical protein